MSPYDRSYPMDAHKVLLNEYYWLSWWTLLVHWEESYHQADFKTKRVIPYKYWLFVKQWTVDLTPLDTKGLRCSQIEKPFRLKRTTTGTIILSQKQSPSTLLVVSDSLTTPHLGTRKIIWTSSAPYCLFNSNFSSHRVFFPFFQDRYGFPKLAKTRSPK